MIIDLVLSLIIYYSARGLLYNREENILKRLNDIVDLDEPTENGLKYEVSPDQHKWSNDNLVSPLYIDKEDSIKGLRSKKLN